MLIIWSRIRVRDNHAILNSPISSLSGDISISIFAKKGERNWIRLTNNNVVGAYFNLNDGTIGTTDTDVTANIQDYGNGWYRCSIFKNRATAATERLIIYTSVDGNKYILSRKRNKWYLCMGLQW